MVDYKGIVMFPADIFIMKSLAYCIAPLVLLSLVSLAFTHGKTSGKREDASNSTSNNAPSMGQFTGQELSEAAVAMRKKKKGK